MKNFSTQPSPENANLDLPDWRGMMESGQKMDPATIFRLIEEYYRLLPKGEQWRRERLTRKCDVEFVL